MMQLKNITAGYGKEPVLRDVSLTLPRGKVTVLVGPNGCGKSTLLRIAARLMEPEEGELRLGGQLAGNLSQKEFARWVALLPQNRAVPEITVGSLVLHGRFPYLGYPRRYSAKDREIAKQAMERIGIGHLENQLVSRLSGGQRQKVYLAMAMAQDTPFLLLDEPTTFLDIGYQLELTQLARELAQQGKGVVMVLHDLNLALTCADQVAVLEHGKLACVGTAEQVATGEVLSQVFQVKPHRVMLEDGQVQYLFTK